MYGPTRCYPAPGLTPLLCLARNARSSQPEIGAVAMSQLLELLRPRVRSHAAPLVSGLRQPSLDLDAHVLHVLAHLGGALDTCAASTDDAFYTWVSCETTRAVLETHAMYRALWTPQLHVSHAIAAHNDVDVDMTTDRGRAA